MAIITASGLKKYYGVKPNIVRALDGVDIEVEVGEFVAVVGTSGSGKSTLLHMIGGLDKPTDGKVVVAGHELAAMTVAIARALAVKPSILLTDEPTGNLDVKTSQDVLNVLKMTSAKFRQTIMMITHNEHIAQFADRIIHIEDGRVKKDGGWK